MNRAYDKHGRPVILCVGSDETSSGGIATVLHAYMSAYSSVSRNFGFILLRTSYYNDRPAYWEPLIFARAICMFVFLQRKIGWFEGGLTAFLFFMFFYLFGISAGSHTEPIGPIDIVGVLLFLAGSYINVLADYQRFVWKRKNENKGRRYTKGLFKYSMHINYFGDGLAYIGLAMITREYVCLLVAIGITLNFIFLQIPLLDRHLSRKYSDEFEEYKKQTKRFIPFVY